MNDQLATSVVRFIGETSNVHANALARFSQRQWRSSFHWLVTSGLALYLWDSLVELGAEDVLPIRVGQRLAALDEGSVRRTAELRGDFVALTRRFAELGMPFAAWKGFALAPEFCPDIRLRPQMDFDFIIPVEHVDAFDACLRAAGFRQTGVTEVEARYENLPGNHYSVEQVYLPKPHRKVELHFGRDNPSRVTPGIILDDCLTRGRILRIDNYDVPVLSPADSFLTHAAHAGRHALSGWARLGWLKELDHFMQSNRDDAELWQRVQQLVTEDPACIAASAVGVLLASVVWQRELPPGLSWIRGAIPAGAVRWIDRYGSRFAAIDFPGSKLHLLLSRELVSAQEWRRLESSALYPIRKPGRVVHTEASSALSSKVRAEGIQLRFVCRRIRFHLKETLRYLIAKRTWPRPA
ncbi:MAG: nucleotidyltransferase family protein [Terriglobales bacterium]